jgi:hypothetical protein
LDTKIKIFKRFVVSKAIFIKNNCVQLLKEFKYILLPDHEYESFNFLNNITEVDVQNVLTHYYSISSIKLNKIIVFLDGFFLIDQCNFIYTKDFPFLLIDKNQFVIMNYIYLVKLLHIKMNFMIIYIYVFLIMEILFYCHIILFQIVIYLIIL